MSDNEEFFNDTTKENKSPFEEEKKEIFTPFVEQTISQKFYKDPAIILSTLTIILLLLILILHYQSNEPNIWEYKTLNFYGSGGDRTGSGAGQYSNIIIPESKLNELGAEGWELVSTSLEMETAYPNFGDSRYVTGLQPNVRPQSLICIFKRIKETDDNGSEKDKE